MNCINLLLDFIWSTSFEVWLMFMCMISSFQNCPKRAMLKAHEHLKDNTKRNNHMEADKP